MRKIIYLVFISMLNVASLARAEQACYNVQGMTCATCGITVKAAVKKIKGVEVAKVFVEKKNAVVQFDPAQTNAEAIKKAINDVGYKATSQECKKIEN